MPQRGQNFSTGEFVVSDFRATLDEHLCRRYTTRMSEHFMNIDDAAAGLHQLIDRIQAQREPAVIVKSGRPVARIVPMPVEEETSRDLIDFLRQWREDYPEPDDGLAEAIEDVGKNGQSVRDPWD
jgi:antitoxin (DNA-binding transcriptional repressor) of toxin-antitoxin stability system